MVAAQQRQHGLPSTTMTRLFICEVSGRPVKAATSAMVLRPGV